MKIGEVANHRSREGGAIVYPVYSRRAKGLSVGINLFPDEKICSFDCPYCEVFPFKSDIKFNLEILRASLISCIDEAKERGIEVKDLCFSGNGEPTMSADFPAALEVARECRDRFVPDANIVVITNGTGLLDEKTFALLSRAAISFSSFVPLCLCENKLDIWLKLDAGTGAWYEKINRSGIPYSALAEKMRDFALTGAPFTLQTMVCRAGGCLPPPEEEAAWLKLAAELCACGNAFAVQIYGKARPAPCDPLCEPAPLAVLESRAEKLRALLAEKILKLPPVEVFE